MENDDCDAIENENKELVCRFCSKLLPDVNASIDHYDEAHAPELEVDECILCTRPKPYKKRENLVYHMALHAKDSIKCIPCRKYFRTKDLLSEHLNECFKVDVKTSVKIERDGAADGCISKYGVSELGQKSSDLVLEGEPPNNRLSQKVLKLTQYDGAFTCQLCNENLGEIGAVIAHYETRHVDDLSCLICLRQFTQQVPLFHLGLHSRKSHICRPCRLFFRTKEELEEHNIKYDHDKSLSCKICGKKFSRNYKKVGFGKPPEGFLKCYLNDFVEQTHAEPSEGEELLLQQVRQDFHLQDQFGAAFQDAFWKALFMLLLWKW